MGWRGCGEKVPGNRRWNDAQRAREVGCGAEGMGTRYRSMDWGEGDGRMSRGQARWDGVGVWRVTC